MNRRDFLAFPAASPTIKVKPDKSKPNVLLVLADQFRADAVGASGNCFVQTPNLDSFARQGVRFSNAFCPQALCSPSRASLFTGVYPHTTRLQHNIYRVANALALPQYRLQPSWPSLLHDAGYYTGYIGKWHLGNSNPGFYDYWAGYNSLKPHWVAEKYHSAYRTTMETDQAMHFLEEHHTEPFALTVSFCPPRTVYDPPLEDENYYAERGIPVPGYYGAVTAVDRAFGRLMTKLQSLHIAQNTLVCFTSDHGDTFGERLGSKHKTVCYDESSKVPFLLRYPERLPSEIVYEGGISTIDLMPTVLEAVGLPLPARLQGQSRLEEIRKNDLGWKAPVFIQNISQLAVKGRPIIARAVRTEHWKLILRDHPKDELYDLKSDPGEANDLLPRPESRSQVRELARMLLRWSEQVDDPVAAQLAQKYVHA